nr:transposase [Membranihabitans marinus]
MSTSNQLLYPGHIYHLWSHAVSQDNLFIEKENYRFFLSRYFAYTGSIISTFAYCLMPNHIHFLIKIMDENRIVNHPKYKKDNQPVENKIPHFISRQIGHFFNSYTKSFNNQYGRRGSLFERPFGRNLIDSEDYYTKMVIYIHRNPVKHGFAKNIHEWPYSSRHSYVNNLDDKVRNEGVLEWFGGFDGFIHAHLEEDETYHSKMIERS